ncbi:hypothetical protein BDW02DRAFT_594081 [Decorospora gaudefroyi]|uniref:BTB domain-containing protein n=1 Tax=Decorospora gaudefroyi TaxID=184978 RepID=A0A6A5KVJ1_9PLEO|nr:hypothetical protein BDW02DRAFT_594081 [Decorospora gaudefroyi]
MATTGLATPETMREPSHESTPVSRYAANNSQNPVSDSMIEYAPTEHFPIFKTGDVFIKTELVFPPKQWQLHSRVLTRISSWFARSIQQAANEVKSRTWFAYTIEEVEGEVQLVQQEATGEHPVIEVLEGGTIGIDVPKKIENKDPIDPLSQTDHTTKITLYNQIFGSVYNILPPIPTTSITTTLTHCEQLVTLAKALGCISTHLTSHLNATLLQHHQPLYKAIKTDPARWLLLALPLKNTSIYTESLIHLSGAHPCWPWPTKRSTLPPQTRHLIKTKSTHLDHLCTETERSLLLLTIHTPTGHPVCASENAQFGTWFVVATFRDILARELHTLYASNKAALKRGMLFRKLARGGEDYMGFGEMRRLMLRVMPSAVDSLEEDLEILKGEAAVYVQALVRNEALVDVEAEDVGWLTCTVVRGEDIPWVVDEGESPARV